MYIICDNFFLFSERQKHYRKINYIVIHTTAHVTTSVEITNPHLLIKKDNFSLKLANKKSLYYSDTHRQCMSQKKEICVFLGFISDDLGNYRYAVPKIVDTKHN